MRLRQAGRSRREGEAHEDRSGDVGERQSPKALCGETFQHEDRAHHGRGNDEREVERGRRDE
jgi:hypothetical protein